MRDFFCINHESATRGMMKWRDKVQRKREREGGRGRGRGRERGGEQIGEIVSRRLGMEIPLWETQSMRAQEMSEAATEARGVCALGSTER